MVNPVSVMLIVGTGTEEQAQARSVQGVKKCMAPTAMVGDHLTVPGPEDMQVE